MWDLKLLNNFKYFLQYSFCYKGGIYPLLNVGMNILKFLSLIFKNANFDYIYLISNVIRELKILITFKNLFSEIFLNKKTQLFPAIRSCYEKLSFFRPTLMFIRFRRYMTQNDFKIYT